MAVLFGDGITYDLATYKSKWHGTNYAAPWSIETSGGRFGGKYIKFTTGYWSNGTWGTGAGGIFRNLNSQPSTLIVQFAYMPIAYASNMMILHFVDIVNGTQCLLYDIQGVLKLYKGDGTTVLATSTGTTLVAGNWYYIEIKVVISATGSCLLKVNGTTYIDQGSLVTKNPSYNAWCDRVVFMTYGPNNSGYCGMQDIIIMDTTGSRCNDLLGDRRVIPCTLSGDGNYKQFSRSAGANNYANVDEIPPVTTDYNYSSVVGHKDTFTKAALTSGSTIDAVLCNIYNQAEDLGVAKVRGIVRSNSQDGVGNEINVLSPYCGAQSVIYLDPNTSQPFTKANFDNAEVGYERST